MKNDIKLYIGNATEPLELSSGFSVNMNYTYEDMSAPTAVRNSWSKSVTIPATKRNNRIFSEIYRCDWILTDANLNPLKRENFSLFINGELKQTGYIQLNEVVRDKSGIMEYDVTLYGGLGDFFYNLAYKDEDGTKRTLADLKWGVKDDSGSTISSEDEFDFKITKDVVKSAWDYLDEGKDDGTLFNFINFAPCYNGIPSSIEAAKVLINTVGDPTFESISAQSYNNYVMANLSATTDEWCTRDLRSYLQRPVLKLSKLFEALQNPENNGGYELELDSSFFNKKNPYYDKAWMTLPLLSLDSDETPSYYETSVDGVQTLKIGGSSVPTTAETSIRYAATTTIPRDGDFSVVSGVTTRTGVNATVSGKVRFIPADTAATAEYDVLYNNLGRIYNVSEAKWYSRCSYIQMTFFFFDQNAQVLTSQTVSVVNAIAEDMKAPNPILGEWQKQEDGSYLYSLPFSFNVERYGREVTELYGNIEAKKVAQRYATVTDGLGIRKKIPDEESYTYEWFDGTFIIEIDGGVLSVKNEEKASTYAPVNKTTLFKSDADNSILDFILSYTKRFGLVWEKDKIEKKIKLWKRDNFYKNGKTINIEDYIDNNNDVTISPLNFDKRFYVFRDQDNANYYTNFYKEQYSTEYGQKRFDIRYPFNSDEEEMLADSVFSTIPEVNVNAIYNRQYYNASGKSLPSWIYLYQDKVNTYDEDTEKTSAITFDLASSISKFTWFSNRTGDDCLSKPSCAGDSNTEGSLNYTLLFYNGCDFTKDAGGNDIKYQISDDVNEMYVMTEGKRTWLWSLANTAECVHVNRLPLFNRWILSGNSIQDSWEWGVPNELFVHGITAPEDNTLFGKFFKKFMNDKYNVNSRSLTCHVDLRRIEAEYGLLGNFYYFKNALWIISEINDYDELSDESTEVKFIKVLDTGNYTNGQRVTE